MDLSQLRSWLNTIDKKTLKRGEDYYDENRVGNIEINNNLFAAFI
jgi:uncharacterized Zn finger protein